MACRAALVVGISGVTARNRETSMLCTMNENTKLKRKGRESGKAKCAEIYIHTRRARVAQVNAARKCSTARDPMS